MRWWSILKSSRGEAYAEFVKEYGPEVELNSLRVNPYEDEKQVQIDSSGSEWVINYAILDSGKEQFTFESMSKYLEASFQIFVEGMFETEYPERYQELLEMAKGALPQDEVDVDPSRYPTYENIVNLIEKKIRDLGLLDDTDYATVHDMPFTGVLEMALEELKDSYFPPPGSPLPRTNTRIKMFNAVLDEFMKVYHLYQRNALAYRDPAERRVETGRRKRILRQLLARSFVVNRDGIVPRKTDDDSLRQVSSIIEVEMNPSGE